MCLQHLYLQCDSLLQQEVLFVAELSALLPEGLQELLCVLNEQKHTHSKDCAII